MLVASRKKLKSKENKQLHKNKTVLCFHSLPLGGMPTFCLSSQVLNLAHLSSLISHHYLLVLPTPVALAFCSVS